MVKAALKKNIKKEAPELEIGDTVRVRILNNTLTHIKKYGKMKITSLGKMLSSSIIQQYF